MKQNMTKQYIEAMQSTMRVCTSEPADEKSGSARGRRPQASNRLAVRTASAEANGMEACSIKLRVGDRDCGDFLRSSKVGPVSPTTGDTFDTFGMLTRRIRG